MSIYAIGDTHLSMDPQVDKPMDIFGDEWREHDRRLRDHWQSEVRDEDTVIIAGDVSWSINLPSARYDLDWIHMLRGRKIIFKGNHDLWWTGITRLNSLYDDIDFVHNNYAVAEGYAICGSRGWVLPGSSEFGEHDDKIYRRELMRTEASLRAARDAGYDRIIGVLHYPPTNESLQASEFTALFEKYGAEQVVYGHIHGRDNYRMGLRGVLNGVRYSLVSLDYLECRPALVIE